MGGTSAPGEQALAIEPTYALAHGFAAWAHQTIYVRAGMHSENHEKSIRHAHAAIEHGPGDAMALALACFSIGMAEHDRKLADEAFERALALSARAAAVAARWLKGNSRITRLVKVVCFHRRVMAIVGAAAILAGGRHDLAPT